MNVALIGKKFSETISIQISNFIKLLEDNNINIFIHHLYIQYLNEAGCYIPKNKTIFKSPQDIERMPIDMFFSIGGDGTFLESITYCNKKEIPIIGINSGRLGFLANIAIEEITNALRNILDEKYEIEERTLIKIIEPKDTFGSLNYALNEITIHKKDSASMIKIETYLNKEYLNTYWADGLILSTPTGSTAYSLSVGGPIIVPGSSAFVIAPIAPHNLTVRPLIIADNMEIELKVKTTINKNYMVSLDHRSYTFNNPINFTIKKANYKVKMIKLKNNCFYTTLRNKLMWGVDKRN